MGGSKCSMHSQLLYTSLSVNIQKILSQFGTVTNENKTFENKA